MRKKNLLTLIGSICLILVLAMLPFMGGCAPEEVTPPPPEKEEVLPEWATSTFPFTSKLTEDKWEIEIFSGARGDAQIYPSVLADILNKFHPVLRASVTETAGAEANIMMAEEKDPNRILYHTIGFDYQASLKGIPPYERSYTEQRLIAGFNWGITGIMTTDPSIKTLADLKGKRMGSLEQTDATSVMLIESLKELGIYDDVKMEFLGFGEMHNAIRDGLVDACFWKTTGDPNKPMVPSHGSLIEVITAKKDKVYPVEWPKELVEKVAQKLGLPFEPYQALPGSLPPQTEPVWVMSAYAHSLGCQAGADEDLIYEITQFMVRYYCRYHVSYAGKMITPESMVQRLAIDSEDEVHPGALRYYKEVALWDAWLALQQAE